MNKFPLPQQYQAQDSSRNMRIISNILNEKEFAEDLIRNKENYNPTQTGSNTNNNNNKVINK